MKKSYNRKYILLSVVVFVYLISSGPLFGQEFPYLAPQAPEFDARGNLIPSAPTESRGPNYSRQSEETISSNNQPPDGNYFKARQSSLCSPFQRLVSTIFRISSPLGEGRQLLLRLPFSEILCARIGPPLRDFRHQSSSGPPEAKQFLIVLYFLL